MDRTRLLAVLLSAVALPVGAQEFEFAFWPRGAVETDSRFVEQQEGACGAVAIAKVTTMPKLEDNVLKPEVVIELSKGSRKLRTWRIPVNASPAAVDGQALIFIYGEQTYRTTPAGDVMRTTPVPPMTEIKEAKCKMPKAFVASAYARCWSIARLGKGERALIALQAPCT